MSPNNERQYFNCQIPAKEIFLEDELSSEED